MQPGVRPAATEVAEAKGTLDKNKYRRDDTNAPRADGNAPKMPDYFDVNGREKWKELIADLTGLGILSSDTREIMIAYCEAYSGWRRCLKMVRDHGVAYVSTDTRGRQTVKKSPVSVELHKYRDQMNRLFPEFGLTPSSRTRLASFREVATDEDPFITLLSRLGTNPN